MISVEWSGAGLIGEFQTLKLINDFLLVSNYYHNLSMSSLQVADAQMAGLIKQNAILIYIHVYICIGGGAYNTHRMLY